MKLFSLLILLCSFLTAEEKLFNQSVKDSDHLRTEQARELDEYIKLMAKESSLVKSVLNPDYSSVKAYENSIEKYRKAYSRSIGYPPPGKRPDKKASFTKIGEDHLGTYYRAMIPILPKVHSEGIYIIPKSAKGKTPLLISMHGGGGSPEVALFNGGANYHDMVRGAVKRGYIVYAPQHLFKAEGYPKNIRRQIDDRMRLIGTSITAVETAKITFAIDELIKRPEVDSTRIGMVGLSYGGFYAVVAPALDKRIKVSVSSCYFGCQEYRYERDELSVPTDFHFMGRMTLFHDADKIAMICPRPIQIQAGSNDNDSHTKKGEEIAPMAAEYYKKLGVENNFEHTIFEGRHEFNDQFAWEFIEEHL